MPQGDTATAQAKQHYQNAVAALGKGDLKTAKTELQQAEKLAPQNALVHYNLALVYSHMGQTKAAQTEVARALQLGLPVQQKQDALHLRQQLAEAAEKPSVPQTQVDPQANLVHELNALILNQVASITDKYRPDGFTFERSTEKLWWSRVGENRRRALFSARISEIDSSAIRMTNSYDPNDDGKGKRVTGNFILIDCKRDDTDKRQDCLEEWESTYWYNGGETRIAVPDSIDTFERPENFRFVGRIRGLVIDTTGDALPAEKAVLILQRVVGGSNNQESSELTDQQIAEAAKKASEAARQEAEATQLALAHKLIDPMVGQWKGGEGSNPYLRVSYQDPATGQLSENYFSYLLESTYWNVELWADGGSLAGRMTRSREVSMYADPPGSPLVTRCFYIDNGCYREYKYPTQVYDITTEEIKDKGVKVKFVHNRCEGACGSDDLHLGTQTAELDPRSPYAIRMDLGSYKIELKKR
jgi:tetratricopeptide (TPR) repeat protein